MGVVGGNTALCYMFRSRMFSYAQRWWKLVLHEAEILWLNALDPVLRSDKLSGQGKWERRLSSAPPPPNVFRSMVELAILSPIGDNVCTQIFMELGPYL